MNLFAVRMGSHNLTRSRTTILEFHASSSSTGESITGDFSVDGGHGMMEGEEMIVGMTELGLRGAKYRAIPPDIGINQRAFRPSE